MPVVFVILTGVVAANLAWWRWAHLRLRRAKSMRIWRVVVALFTVSQLMYLAVLASPRSSHAVQKWVPVPFVAGTYLWSLLVLPISLLTIGVANFFRVVGGRKIPFSGGPQGRVVDVPGAETRPSGPPLKEDGTITRRHVLSAAVVAVPPLITAALVARAVPQLSTFRIRSIHLQMPGLPVMLDGMRIAHVSDLHVGRYTRPAQIPRMIDAVNRLSADLVLFTGDLIDIALADLPRGIEAMKRIDPRSGMALIEGNHDLIENADEFDRQVRAAGLPLLVDEAMTLLVRGQPVQLLGTRWGEAVGNRRRANEAAFAQSIDQLKKLRDPQAFPIVMAHHPHTFDAAAAAGFPLVLAGHTHGGQLMLTPDIGCGPLFYRYWSGLYQKPGSQMVVSNGIGNWFPLRVNAPAEIVEITLHAKN